MFDIFLELIICCGIIFMCYIFTHGFKPNTAETDESPKESRRSREDVYYKNDNVIHDDVFDNEDINYKRMVIMPEAFVASPDAYKNEADTTYFMKPIAKDFWRIGGNSLINEGYLIKVLENKYVLCFGCFIDKLKYSAFNRSYAFFYTDDDCRTFDDYVKDTDTGVECRNLKVYEGQYTDGAVAVLTWDCNGNFAKDKFPFLNADNDLKLVLLSHRDGNKHDDCVSVGIGIVLDESEIIFK